MTRSAPSSMDARAAIWPTPPAPHTATVSPGCTPPRSAPIQPVGAASEAKSARSSDTPRGPGTRPGRRTAPGRTRRGCRRSRPARGSSRSSRRGAEPHSVSVIPGFGLPLSHSEYSSLRQYQHLPQLMNEQTTTRSPTRCFVTAGPTSTISPMNSWPSTAPAVATAAAVAGAPTGLVEAARALGASRGRWCGTWCSRPRCRRSSPASGWRSASRTPRSWPPRRSTACPASAAWSATPSATTRPTVVLVGIFAIGLSGLLIDGLLRRRRAPPRPVARRKSHEPRTQSSTTKDRQNRVWHRRGRDRAAPPAAAAPRAAAPGRSQDTTIRIAYQAFPSGDLIVKNQGWLEKALPDYKITWTKFDSGRRHQHRVRRRRARHRAPSGRARSPAGSPRRSTSRTRWRSSSTSPATTRRWSPATAPASPTSPGCGARRSPRRSPRPRTTACSPRWTRRA